MFQAISSSTFTPFFVSSSSFDSVVHDWLSRVQAAGSSVSNETSSAVNSFVIGCKADGIWTKLSRVNLLCGSNLTAALVPLLVGGGGATDTNNNFTSADYVESLGLIGDGSSRYLNTGLSSSALTANDTHLTVHNHSPVGRDGVHGANAGASSYFGMYAPFTDDALYTYMYNQTAGQGRLASSALAMDSYSQFGVLTMSRTASNAQACYRNGVSLTSGTGSGGTLPSRNIYIFAVNSSGTAALYRADRIGAYTIGSGLTATQVGYLSTRLNEFAVAMGRQRDRYVGHVTSATNLNEAEDVLVDGVYAYVPCRAGASLTIVDVSTPSSPSITATFTNAALSEGMGVAKNGDTVYLTSWHNRTLLAVDVTTPGSPSLLGSLQIGSTEGGADPDELRKVVYSGGYCYVTHNYDQKLYVIDVSDPTAMSIAGSVALGVRPFAIAKSGNYVYIAPIPGTSLKVVDVSTPTAPSVVKTLTSANYSGISSLVVNGTSLWATAFTAGTLVQFDISDPPNTVQSNLYTDATLGSPNRLAISGNYAYVAASAHDAIRQYDISTPSAIRFTRNLYRSQLDQVYGVAVANGYVYAPSRTGDSLVIADFSA